MVLAHVGGLPIEELLVVAFPTIGALVNAIRYRRRTLQR